MRWTLDPVPGFAVHELTVPGETVTDAALRAAHARVLDELSAAPEDLEVTVRENVLRLRYSTELLDSEGAARVAGYHLAALDQRRSLLSPEELRFQLEGLAGPRRELPDRRFHELFEQRVRAHPDAVAAVQGDRSWTYAELNGRANRLARALRARGLRREGVVAVVTERNLDWMAAVIAIFKAGGAYLPIEPHFPADRIATMLARAECRLVLDPRFIHRAYAEGHADTDLGIEVAPDQLAYIYFTSGSTGDPKGAMCEHAGMLNHLYAKLDDLEIGEGQVVAQTAPQCFDISLWQLVTALLAGGRTLIVEQEVVLDLERFVETIADGRVAVLQVVPSYLEAVLSYLEQHPRELPHLRYVSVTGEALKKPLAQRWFAAFPGIKLVNAYGLTETSDDTNHEVMDAVPDRVALGRPVGNVHVTIVDEHLSPVPLGAPGEIVFSGVCVGRGYVNDPERTRAAFMPDPHREGLRLYRSGDFGRWRPDGKLEFLGRRDAQVKIRGFRVELGEIESAMARVPGVRAGAVVVDGERLVAFYVSDRRLASEVLRGRLSDALPEYMVPSAFHSRERLPLTGNGKVDRKALAAESGAARGAPATESERRLAAAWAEVLDIPRERIGRRDHFFDRGGTSLSAVRLVIALDRAVSLQDLTRVPVTRRPGPASPRKEPDMTTVLEPTPIVSADAAGDAPRWAAEHRDALRAIVAERGSVRVRGLGLCDVATVAAVFELLAGRLMPETEAFAPRREIAGRVHSSTPWPENQPMCMHHELSYGLEPPGLLVFACLAAPTGGGATALADSPTVLDALPAELVERFEREGWLLTRSYGSEIGASVAEAFGTDDRGAVERYCRANAIEFEWRPDGSLRTTQRRRAVIHDPVSDRRCWFNQIAFLSEWTLAPEVREYLLDVYGADGLPFNTRYGNGDPIGEHVVQLINEVYEANTAREPWQAGDLLLVDNIRTAHSREPFTGPREVLVGMADPVTIR